MTDPRLPAAPPAATAAVPATADATFARFSFKSRRLEVEFEGRDDFVTAQIQHLRDGFFREETPADGDGTAAGVAGAAPAAASSSGPPTLEEFYRRARGDAARYAPTSFLT